MIIVSVVIIINSYYYNFVPINISKKAAIFTALPISFEGRIPTSSFRYAHKNPLDRGLISGSSHS